MVYVFLADGFEEAEAILPVDILRRGGVKVATVAIKQKEVTGSHGITVIADNVISEIGEIGGDAEMLVLPGGPGHEALIESGPLMEMLKEAAKKGVYLAAICAAPSVLGAAGLLFGKRGTCFPGYEAKCPGMLYSGEPVVKDGNIITARGAGVSLQFGLELLSALRGEAEANRVFRAIQA